jgi:hypothetical protein
VGSSGCNFLLLSLAAKGKKNIARSLCNFLLLSLAAKGKKTLPVPCITPPPIPGSKRKIRNRAGQGKAVKNKKK